MATNICVVCKGSFVSDNAYLDHTCSVTGYKPTEPEHMGERFLRQSKKALERTGSLDEEIEAELNSKIEIVKAEQVDDKLMRAAQQS